MRPAYAIAAVLAAILPLGRRRRPRTASSAATCSRASATRAPSRALRPTGREGRAGRQRRRGSLCFDPSGEHLIAPGTGLYDSTGARLASAWASVTPGATAPSTRPGRLPGGCSVHRGQLHGRATIRKFDLTGHALGSYDVDATGLTYGRSVYSLDVAPDQCTIYYGLGGGEEIKRYDVCTNTQLPLFGGAGICDQLRVRPNGEVAVTCDSYGELLDASGTRAMDFANPSDPPNTSGRFAALDADGTSFWMGTLAGLLARYDIATGQRMDRWTAGPAWAASPSTTRHRRPFRPRAPRPARPRRRARRAPTRSTRRPSPWAGLLGTVARHARPRGRPRPAADVRWLAAPRHGPAGQLPRDGSEVQRERHAHGRGDRAARERRLGHARGTLSTKIAPGAKARLVVRLTRRAPPWSASAAPSRSPPA